MDQVLSHTDAGTRLGIRDRAILETFYSTGIRRAELIHLQAYDVDRERGTLLVRQGKGRKDRMVPIGERALAWIDKYVREVRSALCREPQKERTLFLTKDGEPFSGTRMCLLVTGYLRQAQVRKSGACHLLRHTMATLMLENGADIRFIQAMLGHGKLETTQIYTHVSIHKLKEIHRATHPARLERAEQAQNADSPGQSDAKGLQPQTHGPESDAKRPESDHQSDGQPTAKPDGQAQTGRGGQAAAEPEGQADRAVDGQAATEPQGEAQTERDGPCPAE